MYVYQPPVEQRHWGLNEHGLKWYNGSEGTISEPPTDEAEAASEIRIKAQDLANVLVASFFAIFRRWLHGLRKTCKKKDDNSVSFIY